MTSGFVYPPGATLVTVATHNLETDRSHGLSTKERPHSHPASAAPFRWKITTFSGMGFGGLSVHSDGRIAKTQIINPDKTFRPEDDVTSPGFAKFYQGGHKQAYDDIATKLSKAAGKLYIEVCRCTGLMAYDASRASHEQACGGLDHPEVCVSGFWIQGSRFVTCAHFLDPFNLTDEEKQNTKEYLKWNATDDLDQQKAIVSSDTIVAKLAKHAFDATNVYLLKLDSDSDLAIFQAYNDGFSRPAPTGLSSNDIIALAECDKSQGLYTVGYYGVDVKLRDVKLEGLTAFDQQVLNKFWRLDGDYDGDRPKTLFPVKYAGVKQERDDSIYMDDFLPWPNHRTISTGNIGDIVSTHQLSEMVECKVTAWYQSSGGMCGGFVRCHDKGQETFRPAVFGIFRGDLGPNNVMAAFTAEGIEWLFN